MIVLVSYCRVPDGGAKIERSVGRPPRGEAKEPTHGHHHHRARGRAGHPRASAPCSRASTWPAPSTRPRWRPSARPCWPTGSSSCATSGSTRPARSPSPAPRPLTHGHPTLPARTHDPEDLRPRLAGRASANHWHTDVTFVERPPVFSVLRAGHHPRGGRRHAVGQHGGRLPGPAAGTEGAGRPAADRAHQRVRLRPGRRGRARGSSTPRSSTTSPISSPPSTRPSTRWSGCAPRPGEPALLLGGFAQRLVGHPDQRVGRHHPRTLQAYVTSPENTVRWRWREGDVESGTTAATQHYAVADYPGQRRQVQRVDHGRRRRRGPRRQHQRGPAGRRQHLLHRRLRAARPRRLERHRQVQQDE